MLRNVLGIIRGGWEVVMEFTGGLILLAVAAALLFFGRGRGGDALPIFQNWLVATISA